jgi:hypothetical protein
MIIFAQPRNVLACFRADANALQRARSVARANDKRRTALISSPFPPFSCSDISGRDLIFLRVLPRRSSGRDFTGFRPSPHFTDFVKELKVTRVTFR